MSYTGITHVFKLSDRFLRIFLSENMRIVELHGYERVAMCIGVNSCQNSRQNHTATGYFGQNVSGGVVHGNAVLLLKAW